MPKFSGRAPAVVLLFGLCLIAFLSACSYGSDELQDGYYTAEAAEYDDFGWKEFMTIYVSDNRIVTVEYDAKNASGFAKSWDMDYMRVMHETDGTYPNEYARIYTEALLNRQTPDGVDVLTGATHSHSTFCLLAEAAMGQAKAGDKRVAFVDIPKYE